MQKFTCPAVLCGKEFSNIYNLRLHEKSHRGEFKFSCEICSQGFMNRNHFRTHTNTHTDKQDYKCGNCARSFISQSSLTWHLKGCFVMSKSFHCLTCGKYFKTRETLGKHLTSIHKFKLNSSRK